MKRNLKTMVLLVVCLWMGFLLGCGGKKEAEKTVEKTTELANTVREPLQEAPKVNVEADPDQKNAPKTPAVDPEKADAVVSVSETGPEAPADPSGTTPTTTGTGKAPVLTSTEEAAKKAAEIAQGKKPTEGGPDKPPLPPKPAEPEVIKDEMYVKTEEALNLANTLLDKDPIIDIAVEAQALQKRYDERTRGLPPHEKETTNHRFWVIENSKKRIVETKKVAREHQKRLKELLSMKNAEMANQQSEMEKITTELEKMERTIRDNLAIAVKELELAKKEVG